MAVGKSRPTSRVDVRVVTDEADAVAVLEILDKGQQNQPITETIGKHRKLRLTRPEIPLFDRGRDLEVFDLDGVKVGIKPAAGQNLL